MMAPWPRRLANYPIIIIAVVQQYIWAAMIAIDAEALHTTGVQILANALPPKMQQAVVVAALTFTATAAALGFWARQRIGTLLSLLPQQLMLYVSAGGAAQAIYHARFADGVERTQAFLVVDQIPLVLVAIFHTWAIILIMLYSED